MMLHTAAVSNSWQPYKMATPHSSYMAKTARRPALPRAEALQRRQWCETTGTVSATAAPAGKQPLLDKQHQTDDKADDKAYGKTQKIGPGAHKHKAALVAACTARAAARGCARTAWENTGRTLGLQHTRACLPLQQPQLTVAMNRCAAAVSLPYELYIQLCTADAANSLPCRQQMYIRP
jgi:hypothetical protein